MTRPEITRFGLAAVWCAATLTAACTMKDQKAPELTGPSEFGMAIVVAAQPDAIYQDGASQALITATARDPNGQPIRGAALRAEIRVNGLSADFGSLSAKNLVTGSDGRATFVYTAPASVSATESVDAETVVDILVTPVGTNFNNDLPRSVAIRLLPVGVVRPPNQKPTASFTFAPTNATENVKILFDGSLSSDPDGRIVNYDWRFSDGDSGSGVTVSRGFAAAGAYEATLTVTDDRGATATITKPFTVGANPVVAAFTVSPSDVVMGRAVNFNASTSKTTSDHRIASYMWDFGDGSALVTTGNPITSHTFTAANTFTVTLTVTDDLGRTGITSGTVSVTAPPELTPVRGGRP